MDPGALAALPVVLAGVLLLSGVLKIGDRTNTAASMVDLRVPFAGRLGWFAAWQPWLEIALGVALLALPGWGALAAGWVAALFFAALTVLVWRAALRPDDVHCNCFGARSREPVGWMTVLRNLALTAAAVLVALGVSGTDGFVAEVRGLDRQSVTWLVTLTAGAAAFALLWFRGHSPAGQPRRASGADDATGPDATGFDASDEELVTPEGEVRRIRHLSDGRALLLLFVQADCHPCSLVLGRLPEWTATLEPAVAVRIATSATPRELRDAHPEVAAEAFYGARGLRRALGIDLLPAAVLLGTDLTVAAGPVLGPDEIEALVDGIGEALAQNG
ncbi:hypothetical protein B7R54_04025 [Subtercola boreus]|uniref:Methylamine utilisation protein MauE domain-containing protein n=1 Tax=Subtercola boreus TaxID=120213 RepID=A0A3E0VG10_9MICO|nr:MauE/DoxX family redox-associated membrane protein [Subtercola boreus]RFA08483.1 hypothetical protein B7R54_04025 [Subtercola boreus]TQL54594.1 methylamine utilization protein MauE [Subtercola boreus]